jgi:cell division septum initiation protein DivIVA
VTDRRMKSRVKGLFEGPPPDDDVMEHSHAPADPDAQRRALQVLMLAQRTADDHIATAQHQADKIRADARATAEQIVREAQAHADGARRDAGEVLSEARATAEQMARDAQAYAESTRRDAEKMLSDTRARAEEIAEGAQAKADRLEREAQQRYQEAIGGLAAQRQALQQQIEALQQFDRDYRARLRTFMQGQLRALGAEEPPSNVEAQGPATMVNSGHVPVPD